MAVGAIEPQFYAEFVRRLGIEGEEGLPAQFDRDRWPELRERFAAAFKARTRDEWAEVFLPGDACVAPVLSLREATEHPYNTEREVFVPGADGVPQPAPAPRFSRTPGAIGGPPSRAGGNTREILTELGFTDVDELLDSGAVVQG